MDYDEIEGIGLRRVHKLLADICAAVHQAHGDKKTPEDFMPWIPRPVEFQSDIAQKANLRVAVAAHNS